MPPRVMGSPLEAALSYYSSIVVMTAEGASVVSEDTLEGLGTTGFLLQALFGSILKLAQPSPRRAILVHPTLGSQPAAFDSSIPVFFAFGLVALSAAGGARRSHRHVDRLCDCDSSRCSGAEHGCYRSGPERRRRQQQQQQAGWAGPAHPCRRHRAPSSSISSFCSNSGRQAPRHNEVKTDPVPA